MVNRLYFNALATTVFEDIENSGGKVFIVGGTVRDLCLFGEVNYQDVDVEVYHLELETLHAILLKYGEVSQIGKSFGILKVSSLPNYDFALPRKEVSVGNKHTDFTVEIDKNMEPKLASMRRDITINAMLYNYRSGEILDFHGGQKDLERRQIRLVNTKTFTEDPLRILRVARFAAKYQFSIVEETKEQCLQMVQAGMLETLSQERVFEELNKILMTPRPSHGLTFLSDIQALPSYLLVLKDTFQRLDYHPEGNVWNHTLLVVDLASLTKYKASNPSAFMWSCLLHDIGKPKTTTPTGSAPRHQMVGVEVFDKECTALIKSKTLRVYIRTMIKHHMDLMNMAKNHAHDKVYYRLLRDINNKVPIEDLLLLTKCDKLGRLRNGSEDVEKLDIYVQDCFQRLGTTALKPYITGETLIALGLTPSTQFSRILKDAYTMQIQGKSKEAIIKEIRRKY